MHDNDYPDWICSACAHQAGGKEPATLMITTHHMDICDVCNEFTIVADPRAFGNPKVKSQFNKAKILGELENAKKLFISQGNISAADELYRWINHYRFSDVKPLYMEPIDD